MRRTALAVVLLVGVGMVGACSGDDSDTEAGDTEAGDTGATEAEVELVGPEEFEARMEDPDALVVNVHVPYEGEIAGTDLFVPFDQVETTDELPEDRDRPLVVYCRSGNMSADATADLAAMGYTDVTDLEGGMIAWEESGRALEHTDAGAAATEAAERP